MTLEIPHFEHRTVFMNAVLPMRFWYDAERGQIDAVGSCFAQPVFEDLPLDAQRQAARAMGFDPEKLGLESMGKIVRAVRLGLEWLEANPDQTTEDLEMLMWQARESDEHTS